MLRNAWLDVLALEGEITKSPCLTRNVSSCQWGCLQPNNPYSRSTNFLLFLTALATDTASYIFPKSLFSSLFFFGLTALPLDFVLKECGHYHYFGTRQIFSQHVCSMNILLILYLSALMSLTLSLDRISCVIFFSQIKEMSQSQGISYLSVQKIQGYKV